MGDRSSSGGLSVLVVDDHRISREFTVAALRASAGRVNQAASAAAALQAALRDTPDVIFMDIQLAGESGIDLTRRIIDSWPAGTPLPRVILLSAEAASPEQLQAVDVEAVLVKPVSPRALRQLLLQERGQKRADSGMPVADSGLQDLFRQELRLRLGELDECVFNGNRAAAAAILHQLIASSGLCKEHGLESRMRAMLADYRVSRAAGDLARSYYSVWSAARTYLDSGGRARPF